MYLEQHPPPLMTTLGPAGKKHAYEKPRAGFRQCEEKIPRAEMRRDGSRYGTVSFGRSMHAVHHS